MDSQVDDDAALDSGENSAMNQFSVVGAVHTADRRTQPWERSEPSAIHPTTATREAQIDALVRAGWWTVKELAELAHCGEAQAWRLLKRIAARQMPDAIMVRQTRKAAFHQPWEYRTFPVVQNVRTR